jgi:NAD(P)-dependent dehydrogenase (short-subunit alcohol dehydrogenase family)
MAVDYGPVNIRVNAICPAAIDTPMLRKDATDLRPDDPDAIVQMWGRAHPLGRVGRSEEIADLVLFLASPRASFISGGAYLIDGGKMSRLPE